MEEDIIKFKNPYWSMTLKLSYLQRRVIVRSIIYYYLNDSVLADCDYDAISRQLVRYMDSASEEDMLNTTYYYCMKDFDGSTGFDLFNRLNKDDQEKLFRIAMDVLRLNLESRGK